VSEYNVRVFCTAWLRGREGLNVGVPTLTHDRVPSFQTERLYLLTISITVQFYTLAIVSTGCRWMR